MALARVVLSHSNSRAGFAFCSRRYSCGNNHVVIRGQAYPRDDWTNIPETILTKLNVPSPLAVPNHPLAILKHKIESALPDFDSLSTASPVVSVTKNFDELGFSLDHPGRSKANSYYINEHVMLQTHASAHEVSTFHSGRPMWLLTADVYRRDEIDASHYPVFHQMEGARSLPANAESLEKLAEENLSLSSLLCQENLIIQDISRIGSQNPLQDSHDAVLAQRLAENLKLSLNKLILSLFSSYLSTDHSEPLQVRWIDAYFPFTSPSYEVEVFFRGKWLEILGCGVVNTSTLIRAGVLILLSEQDASTNSL